MPLLPDRPLETVPCTARRHDIGVNTLYTWLRRGDIPRSLYVELGGRTYVRARAFAAWLDGTDQPASDDSPASLPLHTRRVG